jgi:hypothetical protein
MSLRDGRFHQLRILFNTVRISSRCIFGQGGGISAGIVDHEKIVRLRSREHTVDLAAVLKIDELRLRFH